MCIRDSVGSEMCIRDRYCTDNAAMIGITAHYKYLAGAFDSLDTTASARSNW
jgi:tRNA A37 threonylcarbamoyltransferase TsaD